MNIIYFHFIKNIKIVLHLKNVEIAIYSKI